MGNDTSVRAAINASHSQNGIHAPALDAVGLISQLKLILDNPDALKGVSSGQRDEIQRLSLGVARSLEKPFDTTMRIMFSPLPLVATRIGQDHEIFAALAESNGPMTLTAIAKATSLKAGVLEPLLDYLCTQNMVRQIAPELFVATKLTLALNEPLSRSTTIHFHNSVTPGFVGLNEELKKSDRTVAPFQGALNTNDEYYTWLETHPVEKAAFHHYMESQFAELPTWLDVVDFPAEFAVGVKNDEPVFVDIGGGVGHQSEALRRTYPKLPGRLVLQEKPDVVDHALRVDGMEAMAYDYLTEQPVKNARAYYLRQILHNNDDETCIEIIRSLLPAMGPESRIIIDDKVLPDDKPAPDTPGVEFTAGLSLAMYMFFNALERREAHWRRLLARAGLKIVEIRKFNHFHDSIIIAVPS